MALRYSKHPLPPIHSHTRTPLTLPRTLVAHILFAFAAVFLSLSPLSRPVSPEGAPHPTPLPPESRGRGLGLQMSTRTPGHGLRVRFLARAALVGGQSRPARFTDGERNPERFGDRPQVTEPELDPGSPALPSGAGPRLPEPGERRAPRRPPANARWVRAGPSPSRRPGAGTKARRRPDVSPPGPRRGRAL